MKLFFLLYLALFLQDPPPGEHPVPLAPDFDAAKCVECHEDKAAGKVVHSAIATGCASCHQIETKGETTRITLMAQGGELCAMCHEVNKTDTVHAPYDKGQCTLCHDPHASEFPKVLRAQGNDLCASCHLPRQPAPTAPVQVFASSKATIPAEEYQAIPKILLDRSGLKGHPYMGHPISGGKDPFREGEAYGCMSCHVPHQASVVRLLRDEWKELSVCDRCHDVVKPKKALPTAEIPPEQLPKLAGTAEKKKKKP